MICKHCGEVIEKRGDSYKVIKASICNWEITEDICYRKVREEGTYDYYVYPDKHEPCKNSIVKDIIKDL